MAIRAINTAATKNYVSELDTSVDEKGNPLPEATVWKLGAMDSYIQAHVTSKSTSYAVKEGIDVSSLKGKDKEEVSNSMDYRIDAHAMFIEVCRFCIRGWENFEGVDGKPVKFKTVKTNLRGRMYDVVDSELLAQIPIEIMQELYVEVNNLSNLSDTDVKNLDGE